jgi:hypothetical protein
MTNGETDRELSELTTGEENRRMIRPTALPADLERRHGAQVTHVTVLDFDCVRETTTVNVRDRHVRRAGS